MCEDNYNVRVIISKYTSYRFAEFIDLIDLGFLSEIILQLLMNYKLFIL